MAEAPRGSMPGLRRPRPQVAPDAGAGPVIVHQCVVYVCAVLDLMFALMLWVQTGVVLVLGAMHMYLYYVHLAAAIVVALMKAWIFVGRLGWTWLSAAGQV